MVVYNYSTDIITIDVSQKHLYFSEINHSHYLTLLWW